MASPTLAQDRCTCSAHLQVRERTEFLDSMRAMGRGKQYEQLVAGEVHQRLTRLKQLGVEEGMQQHQQLVTQRAAALRSQAPWQQQEGRHRQ
jgi:hypothetical protein